MSEIDPSPSEEPSKVILSVDDSRSVRMIIKKLLEPYACEVIEATNGSDGLKKAETFMPDLILLDVSMPRLNGKQMLQKLSDDSRMFMIPVIMLTAEGDKESLKGYLKNGASGYIIKPFEPEQLLDKVKHLIGLDLR